MLCSTSCPVRLVVACWCLAFPFCPPVGPKSGMSEALSSTSSYCSDALSELRRVSLVQASPACSSLLCGHLASAATRRVLHLFLLFFFFPASAASSIECCSTLRETVQSAPAVGEQHQWTSTLSPKRVPLGFVPCADACTIHFDFFIFAPPIACALGCAALRCLAGRRTRTCCRADDGRLLLF